MPTCGKVARLDAGGARRFFGVTLPLMAKPLLLAFCLCAAVTLGEFATFILLPTFTTLGTRLTLLFQETDSPQTVARAGWPVLVIALGVATWLWRKTHDWSVQPAAGVQAERPQVGRWIFLAVLSCVSMLAPIGLLALTLTDASPFAKFWYFQGPALTFAAGEGPLGWDLSRPGSMPLAAATALVALAVCAGSLVTRRRWLAVPMYITVSGGGDFAGLRRCGGARQTGRPRRPGRQILCGRPGRL